MTTPSRTGDHPSPAIAVVTATYNRSRALACAIESVRRQTFADWEMLVVGDACTDDTADVVARAGDPRIRFVNLARNFGEQSGPNNVGVAQTTAPLVAFLGHDDVWLPDHLRLCRESLMAEAADFVFGTAANIQRESPLPLQMSTLVLDFDGLGVDHGYAPEEGARGFVPASCWLVKRAVLERLGGWSPARRCRIAPSQDFIFRAWRAGYRLHALGHITLVVASSGTRAGSYRTNDAAEQEWALAHAEDPAFGAELAAQLRETNEAYAGRQRVGLPYWRRVLRRVVALVGVHPQHLAAWRRGQRPGDFVAGLRRLRGLVALTPSGRARATTAALRFDMVRRACRVEPGAVISFGAGSGGARFLASGWSHPEERGVWNDGHEARLLFDFGSRVTGDLVFDFCVRALPGRGGAAQTVAVRVGRDQPEETWTLAAEEGELRRGLRVSAHAAHASVVEIAFRFPGAVSPRALGRSDETRVLALMLVGLEIRRA